MSNIINSRYKRFKKIVLPEYKENKSLTRYPINLQGGNILPEEFEEFIPIVRQLLKECPIKTGTGILNISSSDIEVVGSLGLSSKPLLIVSNNPLCRGWEGKFNLVKTSDNRLLPSLSKLKSKRSFDLKSNTVYLFNSNFIYETKNSNRKINQIIVNISLPNNQIIT